MRLKVKTLRFRAQFLAATRGLLFLLILFSLANCSFKRPADEGPAPTEKVISKSFFGEFTADGKFKPYRFLCGAAPLVQRGAWSEAVYMHAHNYMFNCNVEFKITEKYLIGREVNPTFPNDRERWKELIYIPITAHFYEEKSRDSRGRETNTTVRNTNRSHWSARPNIALNLQGTTINQLGYASLPGGNFGTNISEVEWDLERNFLGFNVDVSGTYLKEEASATFRYNFLKFDHNPDFKKTPYHFENAKYFGMAAILGKRVDGIHGTDYIAKWDVNKVHEFYLNNFPDDVVPIAEDVVDSWNDAFEKVSGKRPFKLNFDTPKYEFDLRYNSFNWVDDNRISINRGTLGIAMLNADVMNGEMIWGAMTIFAPRLKRIINRSSPTPSGGSSGVSKGLDRPQFGLLYPDASTSETFRPVPFESIRPIDQQSAINELNGILEDRSSDFSRLRSLLDSSGISSLSDLLGLNTDGLNLITVNNLAALFGLDGDSTAEVSRSDLDRAVRSMNLSGDLSRRQADLDRMRQSMSHQIVGDLSHLTHEISKNVDSFQSYMTTTEYLQDIIDGPSLADSMDALPFSETKSILDLKAASDDVSPAKIREKLDEALKETMVGSSAFDVNMELDLSNAQLDEVFEHLINPEEAYKRVVRFLLSHEFGHIVGFHHNFKENILPIKGTVPEKYMKGDAGCNDYEGSQCNFGLERLATTEEHYKNFTTVMGYPDTLTEVLTPYDRINPGPQDILMLQYLYAIKYPVFPHGDSGSKPVDFVFKDVPQDGRIPSEVTVEGQLYKTSYFPHCNNYDLYLGHDPFCFTRDRGNTPSQIVKNFFDRYKGFLNKSLFSFTDNPESGMYHQWETYLWWHSLNTFGVARRYYDYMRRKYSHILEKEILENGDRQKNILEFSRVCRDDIEDKPSNAVLEDIFAKNPELKELCYAFGIALDEMKSLILLPGSDYTKINYNNILTEASMTFGDRDNRPVYSKMVGTYDELARLPIKISAINALTTPMPYTVQGLWPVPIYSYSGKDAGYLPSTFYPREYTDIIASTISNNMQFGNQSADGKTLVGSTIMSMGYFLSMGYHGNDILRFDDPYIQSIRKQTKYSLKVVPVLVEKVKGKEDDRGVEQVKKFKAEILNLSGGRISSTEAIPEFYVYTRNRVIMVPPNKSLLFPATELRWINDTMGLIYVYKANYEEDYMDPLRGISLKGLMEQQAESVLDACIRGEEKNGLRYFFNVGADDAIWKGFDFPIGVAKDDYYQNEFNSSVVNSFYDYYDKNTAGFLTRPERETCEEAIRGQGLLLMTAAIINGFYIPGFVDYYEKGFTF